MERTEEALRKRVRETPLHERLKECEKYIAAMCAERRPPRMTIPLQHYDEDFYLYTTLADAQATIAALQARVRELEEWVQDQSTANLETMRHTDEMQSRALEAEQQLTRRTAELERVSLLSSHNERRFEMLEEKYKELRTLILTLPKVEGEIEVCSGVYNFILLKHDSGNRFLCGQIETEQTAKAIAALWQHRQGMEG